MSQAYPLKPIDPQDVDFSDFNPRGESPSEIQKDPSFEQLKDSVYQYGVLVPIVVHRQEGATKPYKLVDGERRLRAALLTGVKMVPAHIAPARNRLDDLLQAFHIHMLRKQWRPLAQAKALKRILAESAAGGRARDEDDLLEELQSQTGCSVDRLKALRRAIRFPNSVLHAVDRGELSWSHLIQIEESFIEQVDSTFPELLHEIGKRRAREVLVDKARRKILTSTRALIEGVVPVVSRAKGGGPAEKECARKLLRQFLTDPDMAAEEVLGRYEKAFPESGGDVVEIGKRLIDAAEVFAAWLTQLHAEQLAGFPSLAKDVRSHIEPLHALLARTLRRMKRHRL